LFIIFLVMRRNAASCRKIAGFIYILLLPVAGTLLFGQTQGGIDPGGNTDIPRGLQEMRALAEAYPARIESERIRSGEWSLSIDGTWYYWANGRFLTENQLDRWEEYAGIRFYSYERGPLRERVISPELARRLMEITSGRNSDTRRRFNGFLDALYDVRSREEAEALMVEVSFFGHRTRVHPLLVKPLTRVEDQIARAAAADRSVRAYIDSLMQIHGYNWRNIAGTARRSYHSYGVALDLTHRSYENWAYWRWAVDGGVTEWWNIPIGKRHAVPLAVVEAFEDEGFVWGGKWLLFDNIHFEYRPEVLIITDGKAE